MNLSASLNDLIQQIASTLSKQTDELLVNEIGLSYSQYRILLALEWNPRAQQKTIALHLGLTEASVSRQIKLLSASKLISVSRDPLNRRTHTIAVTPLGMQQTEAATATLRRTYEPIYSTFGDGQLQQITQNLQLLQTTLRRQAI